MDGDEVTPLLILSRGGPMDGLQRQLLYLAAGLDRRAFSPTVILSEESALQAAFAAAGVEHAIRRMSPWRSALRVPGRIADSLRLTRLARRMRARLVDAQDVWRAGYALFVAKRLSLPTVVHVRGPLSARDIAKHRLDRVDALIPIARRYADDLVGAGIDPQRIEVIDDAVDVGMFTPERAEPGFLKRRFGIGDGIKVGIVGRITPFKRIIEFVEAVAALPGEARRQARFVIIGAWNEPEYREAVEALVARLGLGEEVIFVGRVEDEIPAVLADLDLLVTFSGGSVMFEAMAMETPVLSVRTDPRHSEHSRHGETAWCVTTDTTAEASAALARLIGDGDLRRRLARGGFSHVREYLSVDAMVAKTERLYARLLGC